jgi:hypothetical protein
MWARSGAHGPQAGDNHGVTFKREYPTERGVEAGSSTSRTHACSAADRKRRAPEESLPGLSGGMESGEPAR